MERYKLNEMDNQRFYPLPVVLFTNPIYQELSANAKITYALFLSRMRLSQYRKWADDNGDVFIYFKQEDIQNILNISHSTCNKIIKELVKINLIDIVRQGLRQPNKIYVRKLDIMKSENKISGNLNSELLEVQDSDTGNMKNRLLEVQKSDTSYIEYSKKESSKNEYSKKRREFQAPTLNEVRTYCQERNNTVDPEAFIDFYESKGWKVGNQPMKNWQAAVRTWERRSQNKSKQNTTTKNITPSRQAGIDAVNDLLEEFHQEEGVTDERADT